MEIPLAVIADDANISQEGKLNILGVFDQISAAAFPCEHPRLAFAFQVRADFSDSRRQLRIRVRLVDEDGRIMVNAEGIVEVPEIAPGRFQVVSQIFHLNQTRFPADGQYKFEVIVRAKDSSDVLVRHETPFRVAKIESSPGGS